MMIEAGTLTWIRLTAAPVAGFTLPDIGSMAGTRQYCLLAVGASYLRSKCVAVTPNGRDYYSALPLRYHDGSLWLFAFRWGLGHRHWVQTGEHLYPVLGAFEVSGMEIEENERAWKWREAARSALLELACGDVRQNENLVPCGSLFDWWTLRRLTR